MTRRSAVFVDSTLREGEQTPGIVFDRKDKILIAESLVAAGIHDLEAGIPVMGQDEVNLLKDLSHLDARIICWCRARHDDIEAAFAAETGAVHISLPVSDCLLDVMGYSWDQVLEQVGVWGACLEGSTDFYSLGAMDASRCETGRLKEFVQAAASAGYSRVRLADTLGLALPSTVRTWADELWNYRYLLEFHGHNDFGMAVANSLTALECGFSSVSMTLLGLGERAGNAPLEEVILGAGNLLSLGQEIDLEKITRTARQTAEICGISIPENKPLLGNRINSHESGIHVAGLKRNPLSFKPYDPESYGGAAETIIWGRHSGRHAVEFLLKEQYQEFCKDLVAPLLAKVRQTSGTYKRGLSREEVLSLYQSLLTAEGVC
ncbi:MAG: hypothetical protein PQJ58_04490 [Spirochaetales bacterium]|nr:hypothetical protein [Spirochaetales bacterium]